MPKPGDFVYQDKLVKCYVTGWGRRSESKYLILEHLRPICSFKDIGQAILSIPGIAVYECVPARIGYL
jgi:hypothetical protein